VAGDGVVRGGGRCPRNCARAHPFGGLVQDPPPHRGDRPGDDPPDGGRGAQAGHGGGIVIGRRRSDADRLDGPSSPEPSRSGAAGSFEHDHQRARARHRRARGLFPRRWPSAHHHDHVAAHHHDLHDDHLRDDDHHLHHHDSRALTTSARSAASV
jgi:hypothetical protein